MGLSARDYRFQLQALLPTGKAWPREEEATLTQFLGAAGEEYARIDGRASALVEEADPRTTSELLSDWERTAGLPDNCSGLLRDTLQARRQDLLSKLTSTGGQSPAYLESVARAMGFEITVEEFRPFRAGMSAAGDALTNEDWPFAWRALGPETTVVEFRAGISAAGEPLAYWGNDGLECRLRNVSPAHTIAVFAYGAVDEPSLLQLESGAALETESGTGILMEPQ